MSHSSTTSATNTVAPQAPVVRIRFLWRGTDRTFIATVVVGRYIVFPAASDNVQLIRDDASVAFMLPVASPLYRDANLTVGCSPDDLTRTGLDAVAMLLDTNIRKPAYLTEAEFMALALWFARLGGHENLVQAALKPIQLQPWYDRALALITTEYYSVHRVLDTIHNSGEAYIDVVARDKEANDSLDDTLMSTPTPKKLKRSYFHAMNTIIESGRTETAKRTRK